MLKILNESILDLVISSFDGLLDPDTGLGKYHRLVYPPKKIQCDNCTPSPVGGKPGTYRHGGPAPFPVGGTCSICGGKNFKFVDLTEDIVLKTEVESKSMYNTQVNVNMPDGIISVRGYLTDLPKIQQCDYLLHDINTYGYMDRKYRLIRESISSSNIVKGRYFECYMGRI